MKAIVNVFCTYIQTEVDQPFEKLMHKCRLPTTATILRFSAYQEAEKCMDESWEIVPALTRAKAIGTGCIRAQCALIFSFGKLIMLTLRALVSRIMLTFGRQKVHRLHHILTLPTLDWSMLHSLIGSWTPNLYVTL